MPVRLRELPLHDGRRLTARDHRGNGSTPLVLLHGLLDTSIGWDRLAATTRRRCLAVDLGGFGGSDLPARPRIGAYADDVVEGLELLGPERVILVGHSLGGAIAT